MSKVYAVLLIVVALITMAPIGTLALTAYGLYWRIQATTAGIVSASLTAPAS
jgi:hypothetical protein